MGHFQRRPSASAMPTAIINMLRFGVPGLGLSVARRGTLVISPYSSCLALQVDPMTGVENLRVMAKKKCVGRIRLL